MRIAEWPEHERPRERLLKHGAAALSEAELLAIFLRTGIAGRSAIELGRDVIARFGSLQRLFAATLDEIAGIRGLGPAKYVQLKLGGRAHEVFVALFLDAQNRLLAAEELFRGTLTQTSVYPREIVKTALHHNAAGVIFAHNHPSGVAEPSRADELLTQTLKQALSLVEIKTLDHFIVAGTRTVSFAERGLL